MTTQYSAEYLASLVHELRQLAHETEWVEFKANNDNPVEMGEYISALSNAAVLAGKAFAYMLWDIEDGTHTVFEGLIGYIDGLLPRNEVIDKALRKQVPLYPELAVRELVANALIHQDLFATGTSPMIEIFDDRIEISNPGIPLVATQRFVDSPPRSRNEKLASLMRRIGVCEERGSGWDKVVSQTEIYQLPAPLAEATDEHTRVVMFAPRPLAKMDRADRVRAVYLHACLRHVNRQHTTNSSIRERFGIVQSNSAIASRLIKEAIEDGFLVPYDQNAAPKLMRYLPIWASPDSPGTT